MKETFVGYVCPVCLGEFQRGPRAPIAQTPLARIRIERPSGKFGAWVIKLRRGDREWALAGRDLAWLIMAWRHARSSGQFEMPIPPLPPDVRTIRRVIGVKR